MAFDLFVSSLAPFAHWLLQNEKVEKTKVFRKWSYPDLDHPF
jgi:hypothetical protein